jgi:trk/ktr system potassium uptake protein
MERFAVIGLGRFGKRLAMLLADAGAEVVAVDRDRETVESVRDNVTLAVCLNSTDAEAVRSQGIDKVNVAIVGMGDDFEDNVMTTVLLKKLGVARVISRATTQIRAEILRQVGADDVVNPEQESAHRWFNLLMAPAIVTQFELGEGYSLAQVVAAERFHGKTLGELSLRQKYNVTVVAIQRRQPADGEEGSEDQPVITLPMGDTVIKPGDLLTLVGNDEAMRGFPAT